MIINFQLNIIRIFHQTQLLQVKLNKLYINNKMKIYKVKIKAF